MIEAKSSVVVTYATGAAVARPASKRDAVRYFMVTKVG